jgi:acetyl-CoA carboxylase biotin carboxyl carrier protein
MQLTHRDVKKILQIVDGATTTREIEFVYNGFHFRFIRDTAPTMAQQPAQIPTSAPPLTSPSSLQLHKPVQSEQLRSQQKTAIRAPVTGVFFRNPDSGRAGLIETGTRVQADQTVAVIKTAKRVAAIQAEADGIVEHIFPNDGDFVEFDQLLLTIAVA